MKFDVCISLHPGAWKAETSPNMSEIDLKMAVLATKFPLLLKNISFELPPKELPPP